MNRSATKERSVHVRPPVEATFGEKTQDLGLLRKLWPFAKRNWGGFAIALVLVPIITLCGVVQPHLLRQIILAIEARSAPPGALSAVAIQGVDLARDLRSWLYLFGGVLLIEFSSKFLQMYVLQSSGQKTVADLRKEVYRKILRLPMRTFDSTPSGKFVTRVTNDTDALSELFASGAVLAVSDILMLIGIVVGLFILDVELATVVLLCLPVLVLAVNVIRKGLREAYRAVRGSIAQLNAYLAEQLQALPVVISLNRTRESLAEYNAINEEHRDANFRAIRWDATLFSTVESISAVTIALVLWFAAYRLGADPSLSRGALYVGTIVAVYDYIQRFFGPVRDLSQKYTVLQASLAGAERIFALMDEPEEQTLQKEPKESVRLDVQPEQTATPIEFKSVTFAYVPSRPVLHDISFAITKGQRVAVVGATGSGKSTLMNLLLRFYAHEQGELLIWGRPIAEYSAESLRDQFAVVPQDAFLVKGTVADNVMLGMPPDQGRMESILTQTGLAQWLDGRGGASLMVEERGTNLSAGERQWIALARAIYRERPILLLDEATANIDSETELRIQKALRDIGTRRTVVAIAHRLSTVRDADLILVLHKGVLAESGTHDELLARGGIYAKLHRLQNAHEELALVS